MLEFNELSYGNANKKADVVDAAELIAFNAWFDTAQWKLDVASLSSREQIAVLCQRLQGPILNAFMLQSKKSEEPRSLQEFKKQLQTLFAKSSVQFTDKALDIRFSAWTLAAEIQKFQTSIANSSLASTADHNEFLCSKCTTRQSADMVSVHHSVTTHSW